MRTQLSLAVVLALTAVAVAVAPAGASSSETAWAAQANKVCVVYVARAKKEFGNPVTPAQLYTFAQKAKALELAELGALKQIPGPDDAGTAALKAVQVDINEVGSAIKAWNQGNAALFITILKRYLNDGRPKSAFAIAGATKCG
jgi:hypothetical protein